MTGSPPDLRVAALAALRPGGWKERARARIVGGWTVVQVRERIAADAASAFLAGVDGPEVVRERALVESLRRTLLDLAGEGKVVRTAARYSTVLNTKGERGMLVDLFRLA
jgi:hypothetical protein